MFSTYSVGKIISLAALLGLLAAMPAAGQFVQDPPPELSFLSTILKVRKNIPYEVWGEVKFPPNGEGAGQTGQALVHHSRNRERHRSGDGMEQGQAGIPAERLDPGQRNSVRRIAGGAAIREERRAGLGERGPRRLSRLSVRWT